MTEQWRPVVGWEGLYEVSDQGRVRSVDRVITRRNGLRHTHRGQILKACPIKSGHLVVRLMNAGFGSTRTVHRLVLEAFIGPCQIGHEGCHIDGNHKNNRVNNLYWGTRSENLLDQVRHGVHVNASKTHCIHGHEFTTENTYRRNRPGGGRICKSCLSERKRARRAQLMEVN